MDKKAKIQTEVDKTLDLLDQHDTLPPDPYFYTRLRAQLDSRRSQRRAIAAVLKPAMLMLLIVLNVGTAAWYLGGSTTLESTSRQELIELLSDDLNMASEESSEIIIK